jgi:hypothetical protein
MKPNPYFGQALGRSKRFLDLLTFFVFSFSPHILKKLKPHARYTCRRALTSAPSPLTPLISMASGCQRHQTMSANLNPESQQVDAAEVDVALNRRKNNGQAIVKHDYHDNSQIGAYMNLPHPTLRGQFLPFPLKLHRMLADADSDGFGHIVAWQPHGRCFVVHNAKLLADVLRRHFVMSKATSFLRQLNLYGFKRLTRGPDRGGYYHELFLRNKEWLATQIHRQRIKGTSTRGRSNPEGEPDFWSMTWVPRGDQDKVISSMSVPIPVSPHTCKESLLPDLRPAIDTNKIVSSKHTRMAGTPHELYMNSTNRGKYVQEQSRHRQGSFQTHWVEPQDLQEPGSQGEVESFMSNSDSVDQTGCNLGDQNFLQGMLVSIPLSVYQQNFCSEDKPGNRPSSVGIVSFSSSFLSTASTDDIDIVASCASPFSQIGSETSLDDNYHVDAMGYSSREEPFSLP